MIDIRDRSFREQLLQQRVVVLDGEFDDARCNELISKLLFLQHEHPARPIHLLVDSPGGSVTGGFAIIDVIDQVSPPTFTYCYGRADAFAAIIVAHGARPHRFASTTSQFSISEPWSANDDIDESELSRISLMLAETIATDTGNSLEQIQSDLDASVFFDANAAQTYNLVDRVVEEYPEFPLGE